MRLGCPPDTRWEVGCALIEDVYQRTADAGCPRVYWQTHETDTLAMKLYDWVTEISGFVVDRKLLPVDVVAPVA